MNGYTIEIGGADITVRNVGDAVLMVVRCSGCLHELLMTRADACELYGALDLAIDAAQAEALEAA